MAARPPAEDPRAPAWLKFEQLRRQFHAGLAARAAAMEAAPSSGALHALLHRLVGAAGAYGEHGLACQARALMQGLQAADDSAPPQSCWVPLAPLCAGCRELAAVAQLHQPAPTEDSHPNSPSAQQP